MRIILLMMLAFSVGSLTACGNMTMPGISGASDKNLQTLHVQAVASNNSIIQDASCSLADSNDNGHRYYVIGNPGKVSVPANKNSLIITCRKVGYKQSKIGGSDSYNAWASGKIALWPGTDVDAESGTVTKYPSYLTVVMTKE